VGGLTPILGSPALNALLRFSGAALRPPWGLMTSYPFQGELSPLQRPLEDLAAPTQQPLEL
jgi:hypothetical protein